MVRCVVCVCLLRVECRLLIADRRSLLLFVVCCVIVKVRCVLLVGACLPFGARSLFSVVCSLLVCVPLFYVLWCELCVASVLVVRCLLVPVCWSLVIGRCSLLVACCLFVACCVLFVAR